MTKTQLKRDLSASVGGAGVMSPAEVGRFLGFGATATKSWLKGLEHFGSGRGKRYSCDDIAAKIMSERTVGA